MEDQINQSKPAAEAVKNAVPEENNNSNSKVILIVAAIILVIAGLIYLFIRLGSEITGQIRDITLIIAALESIVTAAAFVVLCVQVAKLVNFLKYEISPILKTADKTAKKLYGTATFLSDNAVEPTIHAVSVLSGIKNAADSILSVFKK